MSGVRHIGKEANRLEERQVLGVDEDAQIDYGIGPAQEATQLAALRAEADRTSIAAVAGRLGVSRQYLWMLLRK